MIINDATWRYVSEHDGEDVRQLALRGTKADGVDLPMALQQIAGRQTARRKLPSWARVEGVVYPPHLNLEQCSSEQTARYKQQLVNSLVANDDEQRGFVDLTGGFGVDFYWMSQAFRHRTYVEQNEALCTIAAHNFKLLGLASEVCCCDTATYMADMTERVAVAYLDPARRNEHGGRTYSIGDCTPNVVDLLPELRKKADFIVIKLSPMLDWRKAVSDVGGAREVHIVSVGNECKELLVVLSSEMTGGLRLVCVNDDDCFETVIRHQTPSLWPSNSQLVAIKLPVSGHQSQSPLYLYEPNASIMKAGCFAEVATRYGVSPLSHDSHLFLSSDEIGHFPGRGFRVLSVSSLNKKALKTALLDGDLPLKSANISVRHFPMTAERLREKLRLRDGGPHYIFATTLADGSHKLFICRKIS